MAEAAVIPAVVDSEDLEAATSAVVVLGEAGNCGNDKDLSIATPEGREHGTECSRD